MKLSISKVITGVAVLALAAAIALPAAAQTRVLKVNIPFAFSTGTQVLPAGLYNVDVDLLYNRITLRSEKGNSAAFMVPAIRVATEQFLDKGSLVFARYGDDYFLRKLNMAGPAWAYEWGPCRSEKEISRRTPVHIAMVRISLL